MYFDKSKSLIGCLIKSTDGWADWQVWVPRTVVPLTARLPETPLKYYHEAILGVFETYTWGRGSEIQAGCSGKDVTKKALDLIN